MKEASVFAGGLFLSLPRKREARFPCVSFVFKYTVYRSRLFRQGGLSEPVALSPPSYNRLRSHQDVSLKR